MALAYYLPVNRAAKARPIIATIKTIVALKIIFSAPRLVRKMALLPPKASPKPEPRCCSKIEAMSKIAMINCETWIV